VRVVLDTNVVASALLWAGTPERLIEFAGDADLRTLGTYQDPILTPAECLQRIGGLNR